MIDTEVYASIRSYKRHGLSKRQTATALGISRVTVSKYWDGAHTPDERIAYPISVDSPEKLAVMEALKQYFEKNAPYSKGKQTINAKTAWEELRHTYHVGESTVRRYVRELKVKHPEAFIPLDFEPGEVMQVDWCEVKVIIKGHQRKAPVFCAVLPYSYAIFAMILPDEKMPSFLEGNTKAFEFFGGITERVFFDNLKTAVFQGSGKNAIKQERFRMFEAHHAFEAVFMNARAGNEKGSVENLCGLIRKVAFTPMPKGENLKEIQEQVLAACVNYCRFHKIKDRKKTINEMFQEERACLHPLPVKPFEAYEMLEAVVGSDLTFRYDTTKFSLPLEYVGKSVSARIFPYRIEAWYKGLLVYTHARPFVKGDDQYIPDHYLPLLEMRPRSLGNAKPLKYGILPPELETFRKKCSEKNKYEHLAKVLILARSTNVDLLLRAVDTANKTGLPTYDKVRLYLSLYCSNTDSVVNDSVIVDNHGLNQYDTLLDTQNFSMGGN
jgi:transposase